MVAPCQRGSLNIETHPTCESAIFYKAPPMTVYSVCTFKYFYNTMVQLSILDGGNHILLANQKASKESYMLPQSQSGYAFSSIPLCISQTDPCSVTVDSNLARPI